MNDVQLELTIIGCALGVVLILYLVGQFISFWSGEGAYELFDVETNPKTYYVYTIIKIICFAIIGWRITHLCTIFLHDFASRI